MTTADNIVALRPHAPELTHVEFRLGDDYSLEMRLMDGTGNVVAILEYGLAAWPEDFDRDRLLQAWDRWRGQSAVAR